MRVSLHEINLHELRERQRVVHEMNLKEQQRLNCQQGEVPKPPDTKVQTENHSVDVRV